MCVHVAHTAVCPRARTPDPHPTRCYGAPAGVGVQRVHVLPRERVIRLEEAPGVSGPANRALLLHVQNVCT